MLIQRISISIDVGFTAYQLGGGSPCTVLISGFTASDGCGVAVLRKIVDEFRNKSIKGMVTVIPQFIEVKWLAKAYRCSHSGSVLCALIDKLAEVLPSNCNIIVLRCRRFFVPHVLVSERDVSKIRSVVEALPVENIVEIESERVVDMAREKGFTIATVVLDCGRYFEEEEVARGFDVVRTALANIGHLKRGSRNVQHRYFKGYHIIRCPRSGIFKPAVNAGVEVSKGSVIGFIEETEIKASVDGLLLYVSKHQLCYVNDVVGIVTAKTNSTHL